MTLATELAVDQTKVKDRHDVTISHNMQQLESWKKTYDKIFTNFRLHSRIVPSHGEEQPEKEELSSATDEFEAVKKNFEDVKNLLRMLIGREKYSLITNLQGNRWIILAFIEKALLTLQNAF